MGFLKSTIEFVNFKMMAGKIFDLPATLPEMVFKPDFQEFIFLDVDDLFTDEFFSSMNTFISELAEDEWYILMSEPNPESYYSVSGRYPAMRISMSTQVRDYWMAFSQDTSEGANDAIFYWGTSRLLLFSASAEWGILMDRQFELGVAGFKKPETFASFRRVFGDQNVFSTREAIETFLVPAYGSWNSIPQSIRDRLLENYVVG